MNLQSFIETYRLSPDDIDGPGCLDALLEQLMKAEEWLSVEQHLKTVYPGFISQLRSLYLMSDLEYHTCLLIKLRIAPKDIAAVLAREMSTISTVRSRLYNKVFGRKGGVKEWDDFILSIGT